MNGHFTTRTLFLALALGAGAAAMAQTRVSPGVAAPMKAQRALHQPGLQPHAPVTSAASQGADLLARGGSYCVAGADGTGLGLNERITGVSFAGINNATADEAPVAPAYTDYTALTANVVAGVNFPITIGVSSSIGTTFAENQVLVWIDYNQDGDFDDLGELAFASEVEATAAYTGSITIPLSAATGSTRMRVRLHDTHDGTDYINTFNDTPCGTASYGEVEDYTVSVSTGGDVPANDECSGAVTQALAIGSSVVFNGDNTGALDTEGLGFASVWESFTITSCAFVSISYCGTPSVFENFVIGISSACPIDEGILSTSNNTTDCVDGNGTIYFEYLPAGTYYYPVLTEAGSQGAYTLTVSATACPAGYCTASADECDEYIANVSFAGIDNSSDCTDGPAVDYTAISANVIQGGSYAITVSNGPTTYVEDQVAVWIDWDQDFVFSGAEETYTLTSADEAATFTGTIAVPAGATLGSTRMRVRMLYTGTPSPCGTSAYGEVEDYTVNVGASGPAPANDLCGNVVPAALSVGGTLTFTGDNTGATSTGDAVPGSDLDPIDPTVWHAFTTTECSNVVVSYCGTDPAFGNAWIFLTNSCPANTFVIGAADFTTCGDDNITISYFDLPAGTWYLPVLMDAEQAMGPYTIGVSATACASAGDYCTAGAVSLQFEKISNVTFAGLNNSSTSAAGFEDFTAQAAAVTAGSSYPMSVTIAGGYATDQVLAWIDWDQNNTFDAGELVFTSALGVGPHAGTITVPLTAVAGTTRMRVRLHDTYTGVDYDNTPNATPCDTSTFGQVEDYSVEVTGVPTGIEQDNAAAWCVFPNPSNGDFTIRIGTEGRTNIDVLDMTGRVVYTTSRAASAGSSLPLALAGKLAAGTYVLRLSTETQSTEQRIVIR